MLVWRWRTPHFRRKILGSWLLSQTILCPDPSHASLSSISQASGVAFIIFMRKMRLRAVRQLSLDPGAGKFRLGPKLRWFLTPETTIPPLQVTANVSMPSCPPERPGEDSSSVAPEQRLPACLVRKFSYLLKFFSEVGATAFIVKKSVFLNFLLSDFITFFHSCNTLVHLTDRELGPQGGH